MLLRETIRKTKVLVHKSLRNFKSLVFGGYQKLPRSLSFNPFLGRSGNARSYRSDRFYNEFYDILQSDLNRMKRNGDNIDIRRRDPISTEDHHQDDVLSIAGSASSFERQSPQNRVVTEKRNRGDTTQLGKKEDLKTKKEVNEGSHHNVLAQRMKELEMMDSGDVEHVLDIEEALHYYSRLTSPVYLDIVDKFFVDMHSEISVPQPSVRNIKCTKSKRRHGSISGCR